MVSLTGIQPQTAVDWIHNANEGGPLGNETLSQKILDKFLYSVLLPKITLLAFT